MMYGTPGGMPAVFTGALRYGVVGMNSLTLIGPSGSNAGLLVQIGRGASSCNGLIRDCFQIETNPLTLPSPPLGGEGVRRTGAGGGRLSLRVILSWVRL